MAQAAVARRAVLAGAAAGAAASILGFTDSASAAGTSEPLTVGVPRLPTVAQAQMRRLSFGVTPKLAAEALAAGGVHGWIDQQLSGAVPDPVGDLIDRWLPYQGASAPECVAAYATLGRLLPIMATRPGRFALRAICSKRQ